MRHARALDRSAPSDRFEREASIQQRPGRGGHQHHVVRGVRTKLGEHLLGCPTRIGVELAAIPESTDQHLVRVQGNSERRCGRGHDAPARAWCSMASAAWAACRGVSSAGSRPKAATSPDVMEVDHAAAERHGLRGRLFERTMALVFGDRPLRIRHVYIEQRDARALPPYGIGRRSIVRNDFGARLRAGIGGALALPAAGIVHQPMPLDTVAQRVARETELCRRM